MNGIGETRAKVWNDREFAEEWEFRGERVLRYRPLRSYPWTYRIGQFTKAHGPFSNRRDRPMTSGEIRAFKKARSIRIGG